MDQEVLRRRSAVFDIVYKHTLLVYRHYVPVWFRLFLELLLLCLAMVTIYLWGYVHFTYILASDDCLLNVTQRPFPPDVILRVEVYTNSSELWLKRQNKVQKIYDDIYNSTCPTANSVVEMSREEFVAESCDLSGIWNWIGLQYICQYSMNGIYTGLDLLDRFSDKIIETADLPEKMTRETQENSDLENAASNTNDLDLNTTIEARDTSSVTDGSTENMVHEIQDSSVTKDNAENMMQDIQRSSVTKHTVDSTTPELQQSSTEENELGNITQEINESSTESVSKKCSKLNLMIGKEYILGGINGSNREDFGKNYSLLDIFEYHELQLLATDYTIFEFTQESGYLSLSKSARAKLGIPVQNMYIDPNKNTCFGGPFGRFLTKYFLGYEMMVISSFKDLMPQTYGMGYVKNLLSGSQYYYRVQWMGRWRYGAGILPALFFTLVASVLLRQIHYHIFKFLTHFNHLLNQGVPIPIQTGAQIPFLVITYATIGLVIVMSEVLGDDSVFSLLMVGTVWQVDQFYSIYCRQRISRDYLPLFFFLFHFVPYAYYIRFNGQFWFFPFLFHWFMLQLIMLYIIHHHEIPALNRLHPPIIVQRPQRRVNVRPLAPSDVETAQMPRANFTQLNSTVLQPVVSERDPLLAGQQVLNDVDPQDTGSESSSVSTDSLQRSSLRQTDKSGSNEVSLDSPSSPVAAADSVEDSGLLESQLSNSDLRQARLRHLHMYS